MDEIKLRAIVEETVREVMARAVAAETLRRYNARPISATAFFTGALLGLKPVMDALRGLQNDGFSIRAVLSKSAGRLIGVDAVKEVLSSEEVCLEDQADREAWEKAELILIPALTVNTAAKVANCICDSVVPNAISKSLLAGKLVIAATDGCCPACMQRLEKYAGKIPHPYAAALSRNLAAMREYGVVLTSAEDFGRRVRQTAVERLRSLGASKEATALRLSPPQSAARSSVVAGKRIVGLADLMGMPPGGSVSVRKKAIVTQLAGDYASRCGITIVRSK